MKKILYIANARMPTEKAHGIQIAKMCEAFASSAEASAKADEIDVELLVPRRFNMIKKDLFSYYDVRKNFTVRTLLCLDFLFLPFLKSFAFWLESWTFALSVGSYMRHWRPPHSLRRSAPPSQGGDSMVYTRDLSSVAFVPRGFQIVYEVHSLPQQRTAIFSKMLKRIDRFVAITEGLKNDLLALGIAEHKILVAADAVDLAQFDRLESAEECRKKFDLLLGKKIVMYTGHLYDWKGADTLLSAAMHLPDTYFVFVGGTAEDSARFKKEIFKRALTNVRLIGHTAHRNIPEYLKAADVLVIPNSAKEAISARYTSPLKLFEYMAARRPIVASDLPSLREVLDESMATFFTPDDPQSLAKSIELVLAHPEESAQKADRAVEKVKGYTWKKRAERILKFLCAA